MARMSTTVVFMHDVNALKVTEHGVTYWRPVIVYDGERKALNKKLPRKRDIVPYRRAVAERLRRRKAARL